MTDELCPCGQPLHYINVETRMLVEDLIARLGPVVIVVTPHARYRVPRHYIALHGISTAELDGVAEHYGWEKVA